MAESFSSGIFIPIEKQSLFILAFEDVLVNSFNVIPIFGPNTKKNECEIIFAQSKTKAPKHTKSWKRESVKAKMFLKEHVNILVGAVTSNKAATSTTTTNTAGSDEETTSRKKHHTKMIDLTESEYEVIVLDETLSDLEQTFGQLRTTEGVVGNLNLNNEELGSSSSGINLETEGDVDDKEDDYNVAFDRISNRLVLQVENDIQILYEKNMRKSPNKEGKSSIVSPEHKKSVSCLKEKPDNEIALNVLGAKSKLNNKVFNRTDSDLSNISVIINNKGSRTVKHTKRTHPCSHEDVFSFGNINENPSKKKRKLIGSNIPNTATNIPSAPLSDGVLKYYNNIEKSLHTFKSVIKDGCKGYSLNSNTDCNRSPKKKKKKNNTNPSIRKKKQVSVLQEKSVQNLTPEQLSLNQIDSQRIANYHIPQNIPSQLYPIPNAMNIPFGGTYVPHPHGYTPVGAYNFQYGISNFKPIQFSNNIPNYNNPFTHNRGFRRNFDEDTNIFNPNPYNVDQEGLRPIAIDGCNVAIRFGKGKFAPEGLVTCVDYFVRRGHERIKVFLPQFREAEIPKELLTDLKKKCEMVFTPSMCINGVVRSSYDDRFIVQYAFEFDAVIVSNDNYRDLLKENPKWKATIQNRLLMFNFIDDSVMFPLDPLGRTGPTLKEFLRF